MKKRDCKSVFSDDSDNSDYSDSDSDSSNSEDSDNLKIQDALVNDSRFTHAGNGSPDICKQNPPTSGNKWWASFLAGFVFAIISSPAFYYGTSAISTTLGGPPTTDGPGPTFVGLLLHTIIFTLIIRWILW